MKWEIDDWKKDYCGVSLDEKNHITLCPINLNKKMLRNERIPSGPRGINKQYKAIRNYSHRYPETPLKVMRNRRRNAKSRKKTLLPWKSCSTNLYHFHSINFLFIEICKEVSISDCWRKLHLNYCKCFWPLDGDFSLLVIGLRRQRAEDDEGERQQSQQSPANCNTHDQSNWLVSHNDDPESKPWLISIQQVFGVVVKEVPLTFLPSNL